MVAVVVVAVAIAAIVVVVAAVVAAEVVAAVAVGSGRQQIAEFGGRCSGSSSGSSSGSTGSRAQAVEAAEEVAGGSVGICKIPSATPLPGAQAHSLSSVKNVGLWTRST